MRFLAGLLLATAVTVHAHYTFPRLVVNGKSEATDWSVTRTTKNENSKQGIENVSSPDVRCYQSKNAGAVATVPAGAVVSYISTQQVNHPGPTQYYLAKVPAGASALTWDGSGSVWFKIHTTKPTVDQNKQMTWPGQNLYVTVNATIPASTPEGEYLLRVEQLALHMAMRQGGAQMYLSCSQIKITGGGSGKPGPLVALPGAYKPTDPGVLIDLNTLLTNPSAYVPPGPAVWTG